MSLSGNEFSLIGMCLKDRVAFTRCYEAGVKAADIYDPKLKVIYETMLALQDQGAVPDLITVMGELFGKNELFKNPAEFISLTEESPISENADYFIGKVKEESTRRKLKEIFSDTGSGLLDDNIKPEKVLESFNGKVAGLEQSASESVLDTKKLTAKLLSKLTNILEGDGIKSISSGFSVIDDFLTFHPNDLIIFGGRPAMGKTAMMVNLILNILKSGKNAAVFSLEMTSDQITERFISMIGRIPAIKFRTGDFTEDETDRLMYSLEAFSKDFDNQLFVDDTAGVTLEHIRMRCRAIKRKHGLDFVAIDYLQLMGGDGTEFSRERELAKISAGLKGLAKELEVPVFVLSQINRGVEGRPDKRPKMSDLRESGSIEQDADAVIFIYRDKYYNEKNGDDFTEIIISKNRHGSLGVAKLGFDGTKMQFSELGE